MSKIHWSPQPGKLACRRKIGAVGTYRDTLSAAEFVAKHAECPNVFCAKCARIAEEQSRVTFSAAEVEHLRELAEYLSRQFVGAEARIGLDVLKGKLS